MTTACEMRCPWCCRNERAQRAYLVLPGVPHGRSLRNLREATRVLERFEYVSVDD